MMFQRIKMVIAVGVYASVLLSPCLYAKNEAKSDVLFRYVDLNGGKVIHQSIPPDAVVRGYEIISAGGQVLKVVPPAPKGSDVKRMAEQMRKEAELAVWDAKLKRRYSEVRDIESAKERGIRELRGNLSLLQVTLEGVIGKTEKQERDVGIKERNAWPVKPAMLQILKDLAAEKEAIILQMKLRRAEIKALADNYDRDIERFMIINQ